MKLYHFCPAHMLPGIKKEGIRLGKIPFIHNGKVSLIPDSNWITSNPSFDQEWEKYSSLPYRRNAYRITLKVPKPDYSTPNGLILWLDLCKHPVFEETAKVLNEFGDPENWFIHKGRIKPGLFRDIVKNPEPRRVPCQKKSKVGKCHGESLRAGTFDL